MSIERNLLISLLKLTKEGSALTKDVNINAHLPTSTCNSLLQKMQSENIVYLKGDIIEVDSENRIKLAVKAVSLGADLQNVSHLLCWQEFEEMAAEALKINGYIVTKNLHFKHDSRRYEIDVIGCRKPLVVCIDCKRWQHAIGASALRKIVDEQAKRTESLSDALPNAKINLECTRWEKAKFIPAVLSLMPGAYKFYYEVPIVPVLSLQDFISQLPLYVETVKVYPKTFNTL
ncbi:MAG: restriction endonuclease [Candidatus Bathyarchaeota archaeon]|nr:restriction endonuclease [Candidatus Bathyarchaeota archaeon]